MTQVAFERGDWAAVIEAHPLESHDPAEWLRYGAALLHTIESGPQQGKQQQQAALAFVQAQKEGATGEAVRAALHQVALASLGGAMQAVGLESSVERIEALAGRQGRIAKRLMRAGAPQPSDRGPDAPAATPYHFRTAIPLRFSYLDRRDGHVILRSTHNCGYFSCLSTILWDLIVCSNHDKKPALISGLQGMKDFKDGDDVDLFQLQFCKPDKKSLVDIPRLAGLAIPAHHGDYRSLDFEALRPFLSTYFRPLERIEEIASRLQEKYAIDFDRTIALCYRGTDKGKEVPPVDVEEYLLEARDILEHHPDLRLLVQTDQKQIRDRLLEELGEKAFAIEELPVTEGEKAIHLLLEEGKQEFADHLLAINLIMARARWVITHTGNVAFWTVLLRGHCERVIQFGALAEP